MGVISLPFGLSYIDFIARSLLATYGEFKLQNLVVLVPNASAAIELKKALVNHSPNPLLLPDIVAMGDNAVLLQLMGCHDLPQAVIDSGSLVSCGERLLFIYQFLKHQSSFAYQTPTQLLKLAEQIETLWNEMTTYDLSHHSLRSILPDHLSHHGQIYFSLFQKISERWQAHLKKNHQCESTWLNNQLLLLLTDLIKSQKLNAIAVGSTGSRPITRQLLDAVAESENGMVFLEGLSAHLGTREFSPSPPHPCYHLRHWLDQSLSTERFSVQYIASTHPRTTLIEELFAEAPYFNLSSIPTQAWADLKLIETRSPWEEAKAVAWLIAENLHAQKDSTIGIVTNNTDLGLMIKEALNRWNIPIKLNADKPLRKEHHWQLFEMFACTSLQPYDPVILLSLLKHPLFRSPHAVSKTHDQLVIEFEISILRHKSLIIESWEELLIAVNRSSNSELKRWYTAIYDLIITFKRLFEKGQISLASATSTHAQIFEHITGKATEETSNLLAIQHVLDEWNEGLLGTQLVSAADYVDIIGCLAQNVRVPYSEAIRYPVQIYTPFQARLKTFDIVFICDCNETSLPYGQQTSPWLNQAMRNVIGLPTCDQQLSREAHDFCHLFSTKNVILTRSTKINGIPMLRSRWLLRLLTLAQSNNAMKILVDQRPWHQMIAGLHAPDPIKLNELPQPPSPCPPLNIRPRSLTARQIETLMHDPYAIYAEMILKLKKLEPLRRDTLVRDFGLFVHRILELLHTNPYDANTIDTTLKEYGEQALKEINPPEAVAYFWRHKLEQMIPFLREKELFWQNLNAITVPELPVVYEFHTSLGQFSIRGRIDRLTYFPSGESLIIDYKTHAKASLPSQAEILCGLAPQLPIYALALKQMPDYASLSVDDLAYWCLTGNQPAVETMQFSQTNKLNQIDLVLKQTAEGLRDLIEAFDDPNTPYLATPNPDRELKYNDYAHLERFQEWTNS